MTDSELIQAVDDIFVELFEIPREKLTPEAQIFADLGFDSLDVVDLMAEMQKRFKIQIRDDERVRAVRTMGDLRNYLTTLKKEQPR